MDTLTVTQLIRKMKTALEFDVGEVWVKGEVSNLRKQASGHKYFSIKDGGAQIPCVLFRGRAGANAELIENGREVQLFGQITIYEAMGRAQMIVAKVKIGGAGDLQARYEELKQRLFKEGLFATERKIPLPKFPRRIGLVTSASSAALQDMLNIFQRRAPWVELVLIGVQVQGQGAEHGIARAIRAFNDPDHLGITPVDLIITGRGGGSIEDLWNFNEETVARAIAGSSIPVISAVGHEIDYTIADLAADVRAPTPSAAAEIATPDGAAIVQYLATTRERLTQAANTQLQQASDRLTFLREALQRRSPENMHLERIQKLDELRESLHRSFSQAIATKSSHLHQLNLSLSYNAPHVLLKRREESTALLKSQLSQVTQYRVDQKRHDLNRLQSTLRTLSPDNTLARGFSITMDQDGTVVNDISQLQPGDHLTTQLLNGTVSSVITDAAS